jgi:hypothetical protein
MAKLPTVLIEILRILLSPQWDERVLTLGYYASMALHPFVVPWPLFRFLFLYVVDRTPWTGDHPVAKPLSTQNKRTQTSILRVRFEPTIPVFEWAKTVHALDSAATVIGYHAAHCMSISVALCR